VSHDHTAIPKRNLLRPPPPFLLCHIRLVALQLRPRSGQLPFCLSRGFSFCFLGPSAFLSLLLGDLIHVFIEKLGGKFIGRLGQFVVLASLLGFGTNANCLCGGAAERDGILFVACAGTLPPFPFGGQFAVAAGVGAVVGGHLDRCGLRVRLRGREGVKFFWVVDTNKKTTPLSFSLV
jgi:hypothetical protein